MATPGAATLIDRLEDFHEVWSDGFAGDPATVAKQLADYNTGSVQTAKRIMKTPTLLREATSKADAIAEAEEFKKCGLKCRIEHVGKRRLDVVDAATIMDTLTDHGSNPLDSVYTDRDARLILHVAEEGTQPVYIDTETEDGFCLYLACLRDLVRRNMILDVDTQTQYTA